MNKERGGQAWAVENLVLQGFLVCDLFLPIRMAEA